jgi:hypothetical protein
MEEKRKSKMLEWLLVGTLLYSSIHWLEYGLKMVEAENTEIYTQEKEQCESIRKILYDARIIKEYTALLKERRKLEKKHRMLMHNYIWKLMKISKRKKFEMLPDIPYFQRS